MYRLFPVYMPTVTPHYSCNSAKHYTVVQSCCWLNNCKKNIFSIFLRSKAAKQQPNTPHYINPTYDKAYNWHICSNKIPLGFKCTPDHEYQRIAPDAAAVKTALTQFIPCSSKQFNRWYNLSICRPKYLLLLYIYISRNNSASSYASCPILIFMSQQNNFSIISST